MITTTLGTLVSAEQALGRLAAQRLPIKTAYQVSKLLRIVPTETKHFHEQRNAFVKELGKERPATPLEKKQYGQDTITEVIESKVPEFKRRVEELGAIEVMLDAALLPLADIDGIDISAADLIALEPLTVQPEQAEKPKAKKRRGAAA